MATIMPSRIALVVMTVIIAAAATEPPLRLHVLGDLLQARDIVLRGVGARGGLANGVEELIDDYVRHIEFTHMNCLSEDSDVRLTRLSVSALIDRVYAQTELEHVDTSWGRAARLRLQAQEASLCTRHTVLGYAPCHGPARPAHPAWNPRPRTRNARPRSSTRCRTTP